MLHHGHDFPGIESTCERVAQRRAAEILIPFVAALVPEVDVGAGRLVIDPPPGLLDPESAI
jgi:16S rRNA processing protein RimM